MRLISTKIGPKSIYFQY